MTGRVWLAVLVGVAVIGGCAGNGRNGDAAVPSGFVMRSVEKDGVRLPYVMYVPAAYHGDGSGKTWPAIVFLHGKGECGTDGLRQMTQGLPQAVQREPERWPAIVLAPQKPEFDKQWSSYDAQVMAMLEQAEREVRIDRERIMLTGLSQGGAGTWAIGAAHPEVWSALVPVCGYGEPEKLASKITRLPVWCFHGEADDVVSPEQSRAMVAAARSAAPQGADERVRMTIYPGVNHGSWDRAYGEQDLAAWMFDQHRPK